MPTRALAVGHRLPTDLQFALGTRPVAATAGDSCGVGAAGVNGRRVPGGAGYLSKPLVSASSSSSPYPRDYIIDSVLSIPVQFLSDLFGSIAENSTKNASEEDGCRMLWLSGLLANGSSSSSNSVSDYGGGGGGDGSFLEQPRVHDGVGVSRRGKSRNGSGTGIGIVKEEANESFKEMAISAALSSPDLSDSSKKRLDKIIAAISSSPPSPSERRHSLAGPLLPVNPSGTSAQKLSLVASLPAWVVRSVSDKRAAGASSNEAVLRPRDVSAEYYEGSDYHDGGKGEDGGESEGRNGGIFFLLDVEVVGATFIHYQTPGVPRAALFSEF